MMFISFLALFISSILTSESQPLEDGFTTDLIHRDSPASHLYDPSATDYHRLENAVKRSRLRANYVNASLDAESIVTSAPDGEYVMRYYIGTPSELVIGVLDTGSHITWTQCRPCKKCIKNGTPIFDPVASSTFKRVRCDTYKCDLYAPSSVCDRRQEKCLYDAIYGDKSHSRGVVATERFSFLSSSGRLLGFNNTLFGCGNDNYFAAGSVSSGIAGFAGGGASLVRQLGYQNFAYCLTPGEAKNKTSKLHFGLDAVVTGLGVATTPLTDRSTYYYLTLEAITVGNRRIEYHSPFLVAGANIVVDSGTALTFFPEKFYDEFEVAVANQIPERAVRDFRDWRLCYSEKFEMPRIVVHFKGADVEWRFYNAFVRASADYVCLAVDPMQGFPIYGNLAQVNFMVGYDLARKALSFKPTECAT